MLKDGGMNVLKSGMSKEVYVVKKVMMVCNNNKNVKNIFIKVLNDV